MANHTNQPPAELTYGEVQRHSTLIMMMMSNSLSDEEQLELMRLSRRLCDSYLERGRRIAEMERAGSEPRALLMRVEQLEAAVKQHDADLAALHDHTEQLSEENEEARERAGAPGEFPGRLSEAEMDALYVTVRTHCDSATTDRLRRLCWYARTAEETRWPLERGGAARMSDYEFGAPGAIELLERFAAEQTESLRADLERVSSDCAAAKLSLENVRSAFSHARLEIEALRVERDEALAQNKNLSLQLAIRSAGGQA